MKPEEHKALVDEVLANLSDQAKVSTILSKLTEDYSTITAETTTAKETADKLTIDNESLRQANMNLFLKIGEPKKEEERKTNEDTTPKFTDLFDKDGNLL